MEARVRSSQGYLIKSSFSLNRLLAHDMLCISQNGLSQYVAVHCCVPYCSVHCSAVYHTVQYVAVLCTILFSTLQCCVPYLLVAISWEPCCSQPHLPAATAHGSWWWAWERCRRWRDEHFPLQLCVKVKWVGFSMHLVYRLSLQVGGGGGLL